MAKISMFLSFILFFLIAMPTSSSSTEVILKGDYRNVDVCPDMQDLACFRFEECTEQKVVLECPSGSYQLFHPSCGGCPRCCPV
ncbi:hypothetical protein MKW98_009721 [Papaver atlanticum]|uniref:Uncharacterized protein n=1 Tax=Papaver atlanticum TaxID=357466 RepID=A0AAD4SV38_9MAGN|nr:hypothetical protein MKW98_009721 [Papaver atlanticum]